MESLPRHLICIGLIRIPLPASNMAFYRSHQIAASIASIVIEKERGLVPTTCSQPALIRVVVIFLGCIKTLAETMRGSASSFKVSKVINRI